MVSSHRGYLQSPGIVHGTKYAGIYANPQSRGETSTYEQLKSSDNITDSDFYASMLTTINTTQRRTNQRELFHGRVRLQSNVNGTVESCCHNNVRSNVQGRGQSTALI